MQPDHPRKLTLMRHSGHGPGLICRPALGYGLCEVLGLERVAGLDEEPDDVTDLVRVEVDPQALTEEPLF